MRNKIGIAVGGFAVAALVAVSLGGSATAQSQVTSADIANQTIQSWDIDRGGVASSEVRNQSLQSWDLDRGSVAASELRDGTVGEVELTDELAAKVNEGGPKGDQGDTGDAGPAGADGVSGHGIQNTEERHTDTTAVVELLCGDGLVATGGGHQFSAFRSNPVPELIASEPILVDDGDGTFSASGWKVTAKVTGTANVKTWTVCALAN